MANREYIERIKSVILHLHGCQSSWMESVTVQEIFCGLTAWKKASGALRNLSNVVANREYIERMQSVILHLHACKSSWVETVPVEEVFRGQTIWKGFVEVFTLSGHPKAKKAYAWSHADGPDDTGERFVTVLEIPPVDSPQTAVKVAIAAEVKGKK